MPNFGGKKFLFIFVSNILIMILEFIKHDFQAIYLKLILISILWFCVLVAMAIDLGFGVQKAKQVGEFITSEGFRRSIHKVVYYYAMMTFALLFDFINPFSYYLPYPLNALPVITILFAIVLIYTEAKSVREKAEDKLRRKTDASFIEFVDLIKDKKEILQKVTQLMQDEKTKQENETKV